MVGGDLSAGGGGIAGDGGPGVAGGSRPQGGNADPATPEGGVEAFLNALASGDAEALTKSISARATGDLAKIRKGEGDSKIITKLSDTYGRLHVIRVAAATRGDERTVVMSAQQQAADTKKGQFKQIRVRKEENIWKVIDLK
jgi:hypothetical protein